MGRLIRLTLILLFSSTICQPVFAVDLSSRLGLGFKNQFHENLPSLAVQYYPTMSWAFSAALGVDTQPENSKFGLMVKAHGIIFSQHHLNFYLGGGLGFLNREIGGESDSGFELNGFIGGEFFFTGLESLGFTFEAGVAIVSTSKGTRFRTFGDSPLRGGVIFYF